MSKVATTIRCYPEYFYVVVFILFYDNFSSFLDEYTMFWILYSLSVEVVAFIVLILNLHNIFLNRC